MKYVTIDQVWSAIDMGLPVYWENTSYKLEVVDSNLSYRAAHGLGVPWSNRCGLSLRVTCTSNGFGSLLSERELGNLFTGDDHE